MSFSQYSYLQQLTSVRLVATTNLNGTYNNGVLNNGVGATLTANSAAALTIDSVSVNQGDRILLAAQSSPSQNGIYVATNAGSASSIWVLTRSADQQNIEQLKVGQYVSVGAGSTKAGSMYVLVEPLPGHLGIDSLTFNPSSDPAAGTFLLAANNLSDIPNPTTARTNLGAQSVANIIAANSGNIGGGGAGPISVSVPGLTSSSIVVSSIATSSNTVSVSKVVSGTNNFSITFSADPGATCTVNYVAFILPQ